MKFVQVVEKNTKGQKYHAAKFRSKQTQFCAFNVLYRLRRLYTKTAIVSAGPSQ